MYVPMTPDERERMQMLCERMTTERDPQEFNELVRQFNALLAAKPATVRQRVDTPDPSQ